MNARFGKLIRCIQRVQQLQRGGWTLQWRVKLQLQKKEELLQSGTKSVTKWDSFFITKLDNCFYKVEQVLSLQSETILLESGKGFTKWESFSTKWNSYYKVVLNTNAMMQSFIFIHHYHYYYHYRFKNHGFQFSISINMKCNIPGKDVAFFLLPLNMNPNKIQYIKS